VQEPRATTVRAFIAKFSAVLQVDIRVVLPLAKIIGGNASKPILDAQHTARHTARHTAQQKDGFVLMVKPAQSIAFPNLGKSN